uniref:Uncharacterized protein n=1 Tax=Triticum urartu TaxID=4572 RepID=A0A8R7VFE9_TRIUA
SISLPSFSPLKPSTTSRCTAPLPPPPSAARPRLAARLGHPRTTDAPRRAINLRIYDRGEVADHGREATLCLEMSYVVPSSCIACVEIGTSVFFLRGNTGTSLITNGHISSQTKSNITRSPTSHF